MNQGNSAMRISAFICALLLSAGSQALELDATTEFASRFDLNSSVSGRVARIPVSAGQRVGRGALLLVLDKSPFLAAVARARATVMLKEPAVSLSEVQLERDQELFDRDSLSIMDLQRAKDNLLVARAELDHARSEMAIAEHALAQTELRAPSGGLVLEVHAQAGRYINTLVDDTTLITVVSDREMFARADLSSSEWDPALVGRPAIVTYRGREFEGKVSEIDFDGERRPEGTPVFALRVLFVASGQIPANMPVKISIR